MAINLKLNCLKFGPVPGTCPICAGRHQSRPSQNCPHPFKPCMSCNGLPPARGDLDTEDQRNTIKCGSYASAVPLMSANYKAPSPLGRHMSKSQIAHLTLLSSSVRPSTSSLPGALNTKSQNTCGNNKRGKRSRTQLPDGCGHFGALVVGRGVVSLLLCSWSGHEGIKAPAPAAPARLACSTPDTVTTREHIT